MPLERYCAFLVICTAAALEGCKVEARRKTAGREINEPIINVKKNVASERETMMYHCLRDSFETGTAET